MPTYKNKAQQVFMDERQEYIRANMDSTGYIVLEEAWKQAAADARTQLLREIAQGIGMNETEGLTVERLIEFFHESSGSHSDKTDSSFDT